MPRGVYDRSLTKEQRAAQKAAKEGKPQKRKYTKRAVSAAATPAPKRKYTRRTAPSAPATASFNQDGAFVLMGEVRSNLTTLSQVRNTFGDIPSITVEAEAQVAVLGQLRDKLFNEQSASETDIGEGEIEGEDDVQAPNGVTAQSVPLPPPPPIAPVLPTPH